MILIFVTCLFYVILSESKKDLLNNIIIFENTNGDIYLAQNSVSSVLIFGTTLSNEEDRIFYGLGTENIYIFKDNEEFTPFIKININRAENKKIINAKMGLYDYGESIFIKLIGTDNSYIEIFNTINHTNNINLYSASDFFPQNTINKGISPLIYCNTDNLIFISSLRYNEDSSNYFISANRFQISIENPIFNYELDYNSSFYDIKGEYFDCFAFSLSFFSCFYLDIDNNYKINIIENTSPNFIERNNIIITQLMENFIF